MNETSCLLPCKATDPIASGESKSQMNEFRIEVQYTKILMPVATNNRSLNQSSAHHLYFQGTALELSSKIAYPTSSIAGTSN